MTSEAGRYARITQRLADGVSFADDEASRSLAAELDRRIIEVIAADCAAYVTSDMVSQRLQQAVAALASHGIILNLERGVVQEGCFCQTRGCRHAEALLERLVGVVPSIGAIDSVRYT